MHEQHCDTQIPKNFTNNLHTNSIFQSHEECPLTLCAILEICCLQQQAQIIQTYLKGQKKSFKKNDASNISQTYRKRGSINQKVSRYVCSTLKRRVKRDSLLFKKLFHQKGMVKRG